MATVVSPRSATGITDPAVAHTVAVGMAQMYDEPFVVILYPKEGIYDVEPKKSGDVPGFDFIVEVVRNDA